LSNALPGTYEFADFRIDAGRRRLLRAGNPVALSSKAFDALLLLVARKGEVLEKADLMTAIWPDTVVEENNLNQIISSLRRALGETRGEYRFIATVPGKGYRFTSPVRLVQTALPEDNLTHVTIGVLPFENLGPGPEQDYLCEGLTEETIAMIGQTDPDQFNVIGRKSVMTYKGTTKTLSEIGRELGASYLIESSLRAEGGQLRITSKLIRVRDQIQIWSASYDREPRSLLSFQRELAVVIAEQVRQRLSPKRLHALATRQTQNPEAYDLYLRGRYYWNQFAPLPTRRSIEYFTRATQVDPGYALAWSGLADAYSSSPVSGDTPPLTLLPRAREAAENAVRSDPHLAEAQTSLGFFQVWLGWDWVAAEAAFHRAVAADPNYAFAPRMLGILLSHLERHEEARAWIRRACELDPLNAMHRALSSQIAFAAGDAEGAIHFAREATIIDPEFWIGHFQLAQAYVELREYGRAIEPLTQASRFSGGNSKTHSLRGYLLARTTNSAEALEVLHTLETIALDRYVPPYAMALIHMGLGSTETALDWLLRAYEVHDVHLIFLTIDSKWNPLRNHTGFQNLISRCGFSGATGTSFSR
jgi:DNA-binding winged helix-turn-helix (wHTH) protein/Flp pilus assembly protein TadD